MALLPSGDGHDRPATTTPLLAPAYRWSTVGMVSLVFLFAFEAMAVTTIMPTVSADLDGRAWFSATFSATLAASVVGMVAGGRLGRTGAGPRLPMVASAVVFGVGLLVAGLAPGIEVFVAARFLQGLGGGRDDRGPVRRWSRGSTRRSTTRGSSGRSPRPG